MLNTESKEKFIDFLDGFLSLKPPAFSPVGLIILAGDDVAEVKKIFEEKEFVRYEISSDPYLKDLATAVEKSETPVWCAINQAIPKKLENFLDDFVRGSISLNIPGESEPRVLNPVPDSAKILILMSPEAYEESVGLEKVISSVCRL